MLPSDARPIHSPPPGSEEWAEILARARSSAERDLGKPVRLHPRTINLAGDWAFVYARMTDKRDSPIDYADTPFAEVARHGAKSDVFVALLRRRENQWQICEHRTGPTDAVWLDWGRHGAPSGLYALCAQ